MNCVSKHLISAAMALPVVIGGTAARAADIVETAANAGSFETLVKRASIATLSDTSD